jgi:hypothetical protein
VEADEETLLDILKDEKGILNLTFLWTEKGIGQNLEKVTGILTTDFRGIFSHKFSITSDSNSQT